jgi:chaperonin GroEL
MDSRIKDICSDDDAKNRLLEGINIAGDVVAKTMGYRGRTVLIESPGGFPNPTKDGYDSLKSIELEDPVMNMANLTLREAAEKTAKEAGDATTATVVLAQAFLNKSMEAEKQGKSAIDIKNEIEKSSIKVLEFLKEKSIPITDKLIHDIANTSSNGDKEITDIVTEAFIKAGENGSVGHFRSNTDDTFLEFIDGNLLEAGYADERFVNVFSDRTVVFDENPLILLSEITFKSMTQLKPFVEYAHNNKRQLVIVSDIEFQVQDSLLYNKLHNELKVCVIKPPHFGQKRMDVLSDLAMICNTNAITTLSGQMFMDRFAEFLGTCTKVVIGNTDTVFLNSENAPKEQIDSKILELKSNIKETTNPHEIKYLRERISKLSGKISIIKVGALVEAELQEKIARVDDAVCAVRSAKEEGVVAGGGTLLKEAAQVLDYELDPITREVLLIPFTVILRNAFVDPTEFLKLKYPLGYDVKEYKKMDMIKAGIVDSAKAVRNAYINAISVANTLLMTYNVITYKRFKDGI